MATLLSTGTPLPTGNQVRPLFPSLLLSILTVSSFISLFSFESKGGIIALSTSMPNPTTGGAVYDVSNLNVGDLLRSGTSTNTNLLAILDTIAGGMERRDRRIAEKV